MEPEFRDGRDPRAQRELASLRDGSRDLPRSSTTPQTQPVGQANHNIERQLSNNSSKSVRPTAAPLIPPSSKKLGSLRSKVSKEAQLLAILDIIPETKSQNLSSRNREQNWDRDRDRDRDWDRERERNRDPPPPAYDDVTAGRPPPTTNQHSQNLPPSRAERPRDDAFSSGDPRSFGPGTISSYRPRGDDTREDTRLPPLANSTHSLPRHQSQSQQSRPSVQPYNSASDRKNLDFDDFLDDVPAHTPPSQGQGHKHSHGYSQSYSNDNRYPTYQGSTPPPLGAPTAPTSTPRYSSDTTRTDYRTETTTTATVSRAAESREFTQLQLSEDGFGISLFDIVSERMQADGVRGGRGSGGGGGGGSGGGATFTATSVPRSATEPTLSTRRPTKSASGGDPIEFGRHSRLSTSPTPPTHAGGAGESKPRPLSTGHRADLVSSQGSSQSGGGLVGGNLGGVGDSPPRARPRDTLTPNAGSLDAQSRSRRLSEHRDARSPSPIDTQTRSRPPSHRDDSFTPAPHQESQARSRPPSHRKGDSINGTETSDNQARARPPSQRAETFPSQPGPASSRLQQDSSWSTHRTDSFYSGSDGSSMYQDQDGRDEDSRNTKGAQGGRGSEHDMVATVWSEDRFLPHNDEVSPSSPSSPGVGLGHGQFPHSHKKKATPSIHSTAPSEWTNIPDSEDEDENRDFDDYMGGGANHDEDSAPRYHKPPGRHARAAKPALKKRPGMSSSAPTSAASPTGSGFDEWVEAMRDFSPGERPDGARPDMTRRKSAVSFHEGPPDVTEAPDYKRDGSDAMELGMFEEWRLNVYMKKMKKKNAKEQQRQLAQQNAARFSNSTSTAGAFAQQQRALTKSQSDGSLSRTGGGAGGGWSSGTGKGIKVGSGGLQRRASLQKEARGEEKKRRFIWGGGGKK
ncbi:hypothetical protein HDU93_008297 [Gonapodya sp. JEL0774]|nr:hypothetical protein HDU93_008297 [Gonapodya sp. JEL0774]